MIKFNLIKSAMIVFLSFFFLFTFLSCKKEIKDNQSEVTFQEVQLLSFKIDKKIIVPCLCVQDSPQNPCPCSKFPWEKEIFTNEVYSELFKFNKKDDSGNTFTLSTIKTNDTIFLKDERTYEWVGKLHNEILSKALTKMETPILKWKLEGKKPNEEIINKAIEAVLFEIYKEIGFSGDYYSVIESLTKETILNMKTVKTSDRSLLKVFRYINTEQGDEQIKNAIDLEETMFTKSFNQLQFTEFYNKKLSFSVLRASNDFWTNEKFNHYHLLFTGKPYDGPRPSGPDVIEGPKGVIKSDAIGAAVGGLGGLVAGPAGAGTGALAGGVTASTAHAVQEFLDWIW